MPFTVKIAPNPTQEQACVIPDATERTAGVMTPEQVTALQNATGGATPSTNDPQPLGTASAGAENAYSRGDHVHPSRTTQDFAVAAGKSIVAEAGAGGIDFSAATGQLKTPTGTTRFGADAELARGSAARAQLRSILESSSISILEMLAQGLVAAASDPYLRVTKNRSAGPVPGDTVAMLLQNGLGAAQTLTFGNLGSAVAGMVATPSPTNAWALGSVASYFSRIHAALHMTVLGANLSSAGANVTIAPTTALHHVTGAGSIQSITIPFAGFVGSITLIPDGAFTTVTGGNIAIASTAVVGKALTMTYDGTAWYPSY